MNAFQTPPSDALNHSNKLLTQIKDRIAQTGALSFAEYMELALYAPGLGYYNCGTTKFGPAGDFITAPEISPLFGQCISNQIASIFPEISNPDILEFGGGTGSLAYAIMKDLEQKQSLPNHYYFLELSADLRERQQQYLNEMLPHLYDRFVWLNQLPEIFNGVMLANEVLDAMPVHRFAVAQHQFTEISVDCKAAELVESSTPAQPALIDAISALQISFTDGYTSELNLNINPWISALSKILNQGLILLIDYGYPRAEYYHPDRSMGTLMCHYRHQTHSNYFLWPGLQDITAHVDFTAVAEAAVDNNLDIAGFTSQANFLLSCGLLEMAANLEEDTLMQYQTSQAIKRLILPSEMGELFKVMALTRNIEIPLLGFKLNDQTERL